MYVDAVVRFRSIQIINGKCNEFVVPNQHNFFSPIQDFDIADKEEEESPMGVYWVTDGLDRCLVGFLPRKMVRMRNDFDGKVAQVTEFLKASDYAADRSRSRRMHGICMAAIINEDCG